MSDTESQKQEIVIYGYSDDTVEIEGANLEGADAYGERPYRGRIDIKAGGHTLFVHCIYVGHWCFGVGPENGDFDQMPPWSIQRRWGDKVSHSETLYIEVPADAWLTWGHGKDA